MKKVLAFVALSACLARDARARPASWYLEGASGVTLDRETRVPLLRGPSTQARPAVEVALGEERRVALLDLGEGWTRVGRDLAAALGLSVESSTGADGWTQVTTIPEVTVGGLTLTNLRAEVVAEEALVLGTGAIDGLTVGILPSSGQVVFARGDVGQALVRSFGSPQALVTEKTGKVKVGEEKRAGRGLQVTTDGALLGTSGSVALRTASARSYIDHDTPTDDARRAGGVVRAYGSGVLAGVPLGSTWMIQDESMWSNQRDLVGAAGADLLAAVDVVVDVDAGLIAVKPAESPTWSDSEAVHLAGVQAAYDRAGLAIEEDSVAPPRMGFDEGETNLEGDPGNPREASLEAALADALWNAGKLEEAIAHDAQAAKLAGDRCDAQLRLGMRRLQWSGRMQETPYISELIREPFERAAALWDRWASLTPQLREAVRTYQEVPAGTFKVEQDDRCLTAHGHLMASHLRRGDTEIVRELYNKANGVDPLVSYVRGLDQLERGHPQGAAAGMRASVSQGLAEEPDIKLGLGAAHAAQGMREPVEALLAELPELERHQGLTTALFIAAWGRKLDGDNGSKLLGKLAERDPHWLPIRVGLHALGVPQEGLAEAVEAARIRDAGATDGRALAALVKGLSGKPGPAKKRLRELRRGRAPTPDLFAAMAWLALVNGDDEAAADAIAELRLRYPLLPTGDLGVLQPL